MLGIAWPWRSSLVGDREKCLDDHVRQESAGFDIQILERNSGDGG